MGVKPISVPQPLAYAIDLAGAKSDVDFDYLLQTAIRESSLNPEAKASTSSATGLFQFLDSTWLQVMKEQGRGWVTRLTRTPFRSTGTGTITSPTRDSGKRSWRCARTRRWRSDLAAAFTRSNGEYLFEKFGRMPSLGELYIAHFLGAQGAEKLFAAGLADPNQIAAKLFPQAGQGQPDDLLR